MILIRSLQIIAALLFVLSVTMAAWTAHDAHWGLCAINVSLAAANVVTFLVLAKVRQMRQSR